MVMVAAGSVGMRHAQAAGDTRTLSLHHVHTKENLTITYKKNGQFDDEALKKINWIMRDWRKNQDIKMDPEEIDLLWEVQKEVGATEPIHIICGYRSPDTNSMLRRRSKGVARFSQHTLGKAIDFFIPGVPLDKLRATAMRLQGGGVGFYPTSGSPFVHLDIGNVRAWPRMTREQLVKLFPDGRTVHLPADGTPLPGYQLALADIERGHRTAAPVKKRSLLASLFNTAQDTEESDDNASARQAAAAAKSVNTKPAAPARTVVASAEPEAPIPLPRNRPMYQIASAESRPAPDFAPRIADPVTLASLSPNEIINQRGYWPGVTATTAVSAKVASASADSISSARRVLASSLTAAASQESTATIGPFTNPDRVPTEVALSYAAQADTGGSRLAYTNRLIERAAAPAVVTTKGTASIVRKPIETVATGSRAQSANRMNEKLNDPWLRGVMLVASVQSSMVVTRFGDPDFSGLVTHMRKPDTAVMMTFSTDPHLGMTAESFTGTAVVFQATVSFASSNRTAALR